MMKNNFAFFISKLDEGKTVKEVLLSFHISKKSIYNYFVDKKIFINGENKDFNDVVNLNDKVSVELDEDISCAPVGDTLQVIYEDEYYLIVHKDRGKLVHGDGTDALTLSNDVALYYKYHHIHRKIRVCNRIDVDTEGLVIFAKDPFSEAYMNDLIACREITKKYYVLCHHRFKEKVGKYQTGMGRDRNNAKKQRVSKTGVEAITSYKVIKNCSFSLVEASLLTGRTHQIRVQFSYYNHPLVGDSLYGLEDKFPYLGLQAYFIKFYHPILKKDIIIEEPLSQEMKHLLELCNG